MSKKYKVIGPRPIDGHQPGEEFTPRFDRSHIGWLVDQGHLAPAAATTVKPNDKVGDTPADKENN